MSLNCVFYIGGYFEIPMFRMLRVDCFIYLLLLFCNYYYFHHYYYLNVSFIQDEEKIRLLRKAMEWQTKIMTKVSCSLILYQHILLYLQIINSS